MHMLAKCDSSEYREMFEIGLGNATCCLIIYNRANDEEVASDVFPGININFCRIAIVSSHELSEWENWAGKERIS